MKNVCDDDEDEDELVHKQLAIEAENEKVVLTEVLLHVIDDDEDDDDNEIGIVHDELDIVELLL